MHEQMQSFIQDTAGWTSNECRVLDLGDFSKHKRAHARRAFDSLPPGASLEIVARRKPGQLFFELHHHWSELLLVAARTRSRPMARDAG